MSDETGRRLELALLQHSAAQVQYSGAYHKGYFGEWEDYGICMSGKCANCNKLRERIDYLIRELKGS